MEHFTMMNLTPWYTVQPTLKETDQHRLKQRQRQVDFGKNTLGYRNYLTAKPKGLREKSDPVTPDPRSFCSKRSFDGQIRKWRRELHIYDPTSENVAMDDDDDDGDLEPVRLLL